MCLKSCRPQQIPLNFSRTKLLVAPLLTITTPMTCATASTVFMIGTVDQTAAGAIFANLIAPPMIWSGFGGHFHSCSFSFVSALWWQPPVVEGEWCYLLKLITGIIAMTRMIVRSLSSMPSLVNVSNSLFMDNPSTSRIWTTSRTPPITNSQSCMVNRLIQRTRTLLSSILLPKKHERAVCLSRPHTIRETIISVSYIRSYLHNYNWAYLLFLYILYIFSSFKLTNENNKNSN